MRGCFLFTTALNLKVEWDFKQNEPPPLLIVKSKSALMLKVVGLSGSFLRMAAFKVKSNSLNLQKHESERLNIIVFFIILVFSTTTACSSIVRSTIYRNYEETFVGGDAHPNERRAAAEANRVWKP